MIFSFGSRLASFVVTGSLLGLGLSGCGGGENVQEMLGYEQTGPDEMAVIKRPPLIVPPDYNLRPPNPDDQRTGSGAASDSARKTLIGPRSSIDEGSNGSRAILTGGAPENGTEEALSEGQNLLINRTDRAERDLEALTETRAENRVDGPLLRRLLAWTPEDRLADADAAENGATTDDDENDEDTLTQETTAIQVVARSQTVAPPNASAE